MEFIYRRGISHLDEDLQAVLDPVIQCQNPVRSLHLLKPSTNA